MFKVPASILPNALPSNALFGRTRKFPGLPDGIPIHAMMGDQQAALYGHGCYEKGESKNTYGTGSFLLFNTGTKLVRSRSGLLTTLACDAEGDSVYALEGSVFITGAAIQWLRDGLQIIKCAGESEGMARSVGMEEQVFFVPAFTGLGAPYWEPNARGAIFGITRGTTREMIVKSALDGIAYQVKEIFDVMQRESGLPMVVLKVDGGASQNRYLMSRQADLLGVPILKSDLSEVTAWGAAKMAGVASGFWRDARSLDRRIKYERYAPRTSASERERMMVSWRKAVRSLLSQSK